MIRIEIARHDDNAQEIIRYDLFAWIGWPLELIESGYLQLVEQIRMAVSGSCVVVTGGWVKERFVPTGGLNKPSSHHVLRTVKRMPYRTVTRYEDPSDFRRAIKEGIGSTILYCGQARPQSKNHQ